MSTDVRVEIVIDKPRAAVAAFMFDPANDARWTSGVIAVNPLAPGRLTPGSRVERTVRFLGRRFSYLYEVIDARGDEFVELQVNDPFPMRVRYQLDDEGARTRASIRAQGEAGGFYKLAAPILDFMVRRSIARDLRQLKRCLG